MKSINFTQLLLSKTITGFNATVQKNKNGYPFITLYRGGTANNVYFSKDAGKVVVDSGITDIKLIAKELQLVRIPDESANQTPFKLSFVGKDKGVSTQEMAEMLGINQVDLIDFDLNEFVREFRGVSAATQVEEVEVEEVASEEEHF